jgi:hypothetical protein
MADQVRRIEYFYVTVPDQPGAARGVMTALKDAGVNLTAVLGFPAGGGRSQIDLVPDDPRAFTQAIAKAGVPLTGPKPAFLIQGADRTGVVAEVMQKLGDARINITASAAVCAGGGRYGMLLWVAPADFQRAAQALGA